MINGIRENEQAYKDVSKNLLVNTLLNISKEDFFFRCFAELQMWNFSCDLFKNERIQMQVEVLTETNLPCNRQQLWASWLERQRLTLAKRWLGYCHKHASRCDFYSLNLFVEQPKNVNLYITTAERRSSCSFFSQKRKLMRIHTGEVWDCDDLWPCLPLRIWFTYTHKQYNGCAALHPYHDWAYYVPTW